MVRAQIQFTQEQHCELRRLARSHNRSIADLVREGMDQYLHSQQGQDRDEIVKRALRAVGRFSSGRKDISKRHDHYLAEAFRE